MNCGQKSGLGERDGEGAGKWGRGTVILECGQVDLIKELVRQKKKKKSLNGDLSGGPVVKTLCFLVQWGGGGGGVHSTPGQGNKAHVLVAGCSKKT